MITSREKELARACLAMAAEAGAQKARVTLNKSSMNLVSTLNGEVDRVTSCQDRSISVTLFCGGRYGAYSTNKLGEEDLRAFISKGVEMTLLLAPDPCRDLPAPERTVKDASTGNELGIYDPSFETVTPEQRRAFALDNAVFRDSACEEPSALRYGLAHLGSASAIKLRARGDHSGAKGWKLISEEGEYSDSDCHTYIVDSQGLEAMHSETSFEYGTELTIEDAKGNKYSGGWWTASPCLKDFKPEEVGPAALKEAIDQIGPKGCRSGKYTLVIDSEVSQKLINPILGALNAYNVQQKNSFLADALGKKVFHEGMNLMELPRSEGELGAKYFDSEGVATANHPVIENGVVKEFFVNTFMANKTGLSPTCEDAIRPKLLPWSFDGSIRRNRDEIMELCGDGILVTDIEGGNSNTATGDFSFAIQGYRFKKGKVVFPVREMLITGNIVTLWQNLLAVGDDARLCRTKLIPTLAFKDVDFSG